MHNGVETDEAYSFGKCLFPSLHVPPLGQPCGEAEQGGGNSTNLGKKGRQQQ